MNSCDIFVFYRDKNYNEGAADFDQLRFESELEGPFFGGFFWDSNLSQLLHNADPSI